MSYSAGLGSNAPIAVSSESDYDTEWTPDLDPDDLLELQAAEQDPSKIVANLPKESHRLGYYSTVCLIFNRMIGTYRTTDTCNAVLTVDVQIGTGIFTSASVVFVNTQSVGLSLILWVYGAILALAGVLAYIELGLSIPRWPFGPNGEKISTPRSGEALNYVRAHDQPFLRSAI